MRVEFTAPEYGDDGLFRPARYAFDGAPDVGWDVTRDTAEPLRLGPGYRLLQTRRCGICSTDLARRFLPFRLPQVTGHEVLAVDEDGGRFVVEINASHLARGLTDAGCARCDGGLANHCPDRLVLGIHDLPGGFGPWVLAPVGAAIPVPDAIPDDTAALVEPLAAALNAVTTVRPRAGDSVAVLGPRRLGMLVIAALAAWRRREGVDFRIVAAIRREALAELAGTMGADDVVIVDEAPAGPWDVVIDTTGSPAGLDRAVASARREVHLKSTHGQPACGLEHLTELVVDEIGLAPWSPEGVGAVAASAAEVDRLLRPEPGSERSLVEPRSAIRVRLAGPTDSTLLQAIDTRGLVLTSSRCGDFRAALDLIAADDCVLAIGTQLTTHEITGGDLNAAFETASSVDCLKASVVH